jgi:hypothetical protein
MLFTSYISYCSKCVNSIRYFARMVLIIPVAKQGFGKHAWDLNDGDLSEILKKCKLRRATNGYVF